MKTCSIQILAVLLLLSLQSKAQHRIGPVARKVPLIELKGNGYERGLQHGTLLKKEISEVYAKWKANICKDTKRDADSVNREFLATTTFPSIIQQWTPDLWQELKGISDGSGQPFEDVLAFQLVDEYWGYLDRIANIQKEHCSAIGMAATKERPAYVAQNIDLDTYMHGYQVLLHLAPTATTPEQYLVACAGQLGFAGMNSKGVGVVVNALLDLKNSVDGLPVAFIIREMLNKEKAADILSFLQIVKHASGQNYLIGVRDSVYDYEASANQVVRFLPEQNSGLVYHTNHSLVNHDVKPWFEAYHQRVLAGNSQKGNSETRYAALQLRLSAPFEELSATTIKQT
ncbi:MAG TPA: C45 family peptidase, partial [Flavisolibacter sp.]|nr:C45 family peptidase [Flavisolibacter sp.]